MEETKEKLREKYVENFKRLVRDLLTPPLDLSDTTITQIAELAMFRCDNYADEKIALMFSQEAKRGEGMIKVRGGNGVTLMTKEQLAELDKSK